ncbi:short-chain dehydrogenase/reductase SDR [Parafrankia sp. EAN1pec]|uniref:mycofactocin-coupled SDR family oxidoreductase n=1 Tax=Parafrankia sp. (strain EAN1pec) TaxID=298653 RepID=UPI000054459B|nr:short-chain dehydrogenase/reductase SDR [Frankia sp. EAN1pec]
MTTDGQLSGKVALITGAARGQGRSHAMLLAQEGADIVAVDIARQIDSVRYPLATEDELRETAEAVSGLGRQVMCKVADVRSSEQLSAVVDKAMERFGHIDILCVNAGIAQFAKAVWELTDQEWRDILDVNLTGAWKTVKAVAPAMTGTGRGGSIIVTASSTSLKPRPNLGAYNTSKHGLTGLVGSLAIELAPAGIRVNAIAPGSVSTRMLLNENVFRVTRPDLDDPTEKDAYEPLRKLNVLPVPWVEPVDISNAVLWLASESSRYVTGVMLPVDAGSVII